MTDRLSRRALLRGAGLAGAAGLAGCQRLAAVFPESQRRNSPQSTGGPVTGTVTDLDGAPIADASVVALDGTAAEVAATTTGSDGGFSLSVSRPVWLRAGTSGFTERTVAAEPGRSVDVVLVPDEGTAALTFGGDVMFGRRFYSPASDRLAPHHRIRPEQRRADHERVLAPVEPPLQSADVTSVNLESPLTTSPVRHPEKTYTFISHPVAGEVLAESGVDYAALGNNHAFDALTPGLEETTERLDRAGIRQSGAGLTTESAWEPATFDVDGLSVAMLSCCDIVGSDLYDLHWSADDGVNRPTTVSADGESVAVPEGAGVAEASVDRLRSRVAAATDTADVVVVQIHGGVQYRRRPTDRMATLTDAAVAAGADLVVNHHPHVVGGIERLEGAVVAWTLGNFVFDQTVWETFPSYLLTAYVTAAGVVRAVADPLLLDGFVPHGVVGKPNRVLRHRTAARSGADVQATDTGVALGRGTAAPARQTATLDRTGLYERREGWVTDITDGDATLGRALFPTGSFESTDIDDTGYDGALWRFNRTPPDAGGSFGVDGGGGVQLRRIAGNSQNVILSNRRRIPIAGPMTLATRYLTAAAEGFSLELAWYPGRDAGAVERETWDLSATGSQWELLSRELTPPEDATHLNVLFTLAPPTTGRRTVYLDDLRLVEWADADATGGTEYDYLRVDEPATVAFAAPNDRADWRHVGSL